MGSRGVTSGELSCGEGCRELLVFGCLHIQTRFLAGPGNTHYTTFQTLFVVVGLAILVARSYLSIYL